MENLSHDDTHKELENEYITVIFIADFVIDFFLSGMHEKGPQLFHVDPSGTFIEYQAKAIGSGSEGAQQALQEVYHKVH